MVFHYSSSIRNLILNSHERSIHFLISHFGLSWTWPFMVTAMKANFKVFFKAFSKHFSYLFPSILNDFWVNKVCWPKIWLKTWLFWDLNRHSLSLRLPLRMTFWFEFNVIVTVNVSSIVSINHLLIIPHRAHLSQILNHVHRHVSCVLFSTTRYFKTCLSKQLIVELMKVIIWLLVLFI